jgi:hypothetical protein
MTEIEVPPRGLPPLPKLFNGIAQVRPAVFPDPFGRDDLPPGHVIEAMPMVCVGMAFFEVDMGVIVSEDCAGRGSLNTSVVAVSNRPNLPSAPTLSCSQQLLDIDE